MYRGGYMAVTYKNNTILYKRLEQPQILVSKGIVEPIPHRYQGMTEASLLPAR
jgi:hypothetical protein